MSLRIRRGTNAQRTSITFDLGEIVYTTDTQKLYIGDGVTAGGKNLLETSAGNGFTFNQSTQQIDFSIGNLNLNTSQVTEDVSRLYYTDERAQDAVGAALVAGNAFNTGVTFTYDDANNRITAVSTGGLINISADTNPSLGGNLSTGSFNISGNGSFSAGTIASTGSISAGAGVAVAGLLAANGGATVVGTLSASTISPTVAGTTVSVKSTNQVPLGIQSITSGVRGGGVPSVQLSVSKGTLAVPTNNIAGDLLGGFSVSGYYNGSKNVGGMTVALDPAANLNSSVPASYIYWYAGNNSNGQIMAFYGLYGVLTSPLMKTNVYSQSGTVVTATNATSTGGVATITFATQSFPPFNLNDTITLAGFTPSNFNGQFPVTACTSTTVTFNLTGDYTGSVFGTITGAFTTLTSAINAGQGARAFVADATSSTFGATYTGGGSNAVPVYSDGATWKIG